MDNKQRKRFNFTPWIIGTLLIVVLIYWISAVLLNKEQKGIDLKESTTDSLKEADLASPESAKMPLRSEFQVAYLKIDSANFVQLSQPMQDFTVLLIQDIDYNDPNQLATLIETFKLALLSDPNASNEENYEELDQMIAQLRNQAGNLPIILNRSGRFLLGKAYNLQSLHYPKRAGMIGNLKLKLSEINPDLELDRQKSRVRDFFEQAFLMLYYFQHQESGEASTEKAPS